MKFYRNLNLSVFAVLLLLSTSVFAFSLPDFTPLVEKNAAAVVNISTTLKKTDLGSGLEYHMPDIPEDSPFYDFFRRFFDVAGNIGKTN